MGVGNLDHREDSGVHENGTFGVKISRQIKRYLTTLLCEKLKEKVRLKQAGAHNAWAHGRMGAWVH